jgi:hypothetical protein
VSTVEEIAAAIGKLPLADQRRLARQLREQLADAWDLQIEEDAASGRLDSLYARLETENRDQPKIPLDEVLDDDKLS